MKPDGADQPLVRGADHQPKRSAAELPRRPRQRELSPEEGSDAHRPGTSTGVVVSATLVRGRTEDRILRAWRRQAFEPGVPWPLSVLPLLTMVVAAALGIETLSTTRKAVGVLVAMAGVTVALGPGLGGAPAGAWRGDLVMAPGRAR